MLSAVLISNNQQSKYRNIYSAQKNLFTEKEYLEEYTGRQSLTKYHHSCSKNSETNENKHHITKVTYLEAILYTCIQSR